MAGLQRQIYELIDKGYIRESINPCGVPVQLMPTKDGTWRMCCGAINNITILIRGRVLSRREGMMRTCPETPAMIKGLDGRAIHKTDGLSLILLARVQGLFVLKLKLCF